MKWNAPEIVKGCWNLLKLVKRARSLLLAHLKNWRSLKSNFWHMHIHICIPIIYINIIYRYKYLIQWQFRMLKKSQNNHKKFVEKKRNLCARTFIPFLVQLMFYPCNCFVIVTRPTFRWMLLTRQTRRSLI